MNTTELNVSGMTCGHCQTAVTKALKSVEGVTDAHVDLASGKASVSGTPDPQALVAAIIDEGYGAQVASR
ncbi:CopZ family metallochaperone [Deinococcus sp. UYEF24]